MVCFPAYWHSAVFWLLSWVLPRRLSVSAINPLKIIAFCKTSRVYVLSNNFRTWCPCEFGFVSCISVGSHLCCLDAPVSFWLDAGSYIRSCSCRSSLNSSILVTFLLDHTVYLVRLYTVLQYLIALFVLLSEFSWLWTLGSMYQLSSKPSLLKVSLHYFYLITMLNFCIDSKRHLNSAAYSHPRVR